MDLPWKRVTAVAAVAAYAATSTLKQEWSRSAFTKYFAASWLLSFLCWGVWTVILYPKFFSPLLGLPEPRNPSWINGQYSKIRELATGVPMLEWYICPACP